MPAPPSVSVVIPARDAAPTLGRTLAALQAQELVEQFEVIVVVDEDSCDGTVAIAERHEPFTRVIRRVSGEGPGAARNRGARAARASVLAFTDADCFPTPQWLARGLEAIAHGEIVQGAVQPDPDAVRAPFDRTLVVEADGRFYETANLFVRREVFNSVGGFEDWALEQARRGRTSADRRRGRATRTPIGDDTVFGWTARRLGARSAFAPHALVHHEVFPGRLLDEIADRWDWSRDMPGLARRVPELRRDTFYRRWFFGDWTARYDLAVAGLVVAAVTRRRVWLVGVLPYLRQLTGEARWYWALSATPTSAVTNAAAHTLGSPAVSAATLAGLITGSITWRCVVL